MTLTDVLLDAITQTDASSADATTILEQVSMSTARFKFEYTDRSSPGSAPSS